MNLKLENGKRFVDMNEKFKRQWSKKWSGFPKILFWLREFWLFVLDHSAKLAHSITLFENFSKVNVQNWLRWLH